MIALNLQTVYMKIIIKGYDTFIKNKTELVLFLYV